VALVLLCPDHIDSLYNATDAVTALNIDADAEDNTKITTTIDATLLLCAFSNSADKYPL
jgi:hypothetical protein